MRQRFNWDIAGITASLACAVHCAVLPLFYTALPLFGVNIIHNLTFEIVMLLLAAGIGLYSLYHGYKKHHHSAWPSIIFIIGILLLAVRLFYLHNGLALLVPAVALIIGAHILNYKFCRVHNHAHADDCDH